MSPKLFALIVIIAFFALMIGIGIYTRKNASASITTRKGKLPAVQMTTFWLDARHLC